MNKSLQQVQGALDRKPEKKVDLGGGKKDKDESSGVVSIEARLKGSSRDTFPGIPDTVVHLTRRTYRDGDKDIEATVAEFGSQDNKVTKNRFDFPITMVAPSFTKMWDHIDNRQKENN